MTRAIRFKKTSHLEVSLVKFPRTIPPPMFNLARKEETSFRLLLSTFLPV